jgi:hypothetical protein
MRRRALGVLLVVGALLVPLGAAYASHQFTDVPDSHTFHNAIDWMKDNNITVGCNPPANTRYCPDDNVTRGQMAAFMKRLAENRVVDANTLDGKDGVAYESPIWGAAIDWGNSGQGVINGTTTAGTNVLSLVVSPPADGVLALNYTLGVLKTTTPFYGVAWLQYDDGACNWNNRVAGSNSYYDAEGVINSDAIIYVSNTMVKSTTTGNHTVYLCSGLFSGTSATRNDANIVATFSASGLATAGTTDNSGGSADPTG